MSNDPKPNGHEGGRWDALIILTGLITFVVFLAIVLAFVLVNLK